MSLARSTFSIFDPELARLVRALHEACARLERIKRQHPPASLDYQVARLGFKESLRAVAAYARRSAT